MKIGILAVQGAFAEHEQMLEQLGAEYIELRKGEDVRQSYDGLILPGGESTVQGKLMRELEKCNRVLLSYKRECEKYVIYESIGNFAFELMNVASDLDEFLQKAPEFPERKDLSEFYLNLRNFLNIYELLDDHYVVYAEHEQDGRFKLKLYCVDPSKNLQERINKGNATIFFSATLLPVGYYKSLLSTETDNYAVYAKTAFREEQKLLLLGNDVSSKYTRRSAGEFERIASYVKKTTDAKKGNYMVFFPSYKMMEQVYDAFLEKCQSDPSCETETLIQQPGMKEEERESFLQAFSEELSGERKGSLAAFCVMGGIFGEGIDLKNEQLIGAIVVGTGLPQISNEREILMGYFEKRLGAGFDYAYRYPGMNKVLQAAGRVIRTVEDVGVIELLDERFLQSEYRALFPREWERQTVCRIDTVEKYLEEFWNRS